MHAHILRRVAIAIAVQHEHVTAPSQTQTHTHAKNACIRTQYIWGGVGVVKGKGEGGVDAPCAVHAIHMEVIHLKRVATY